MQIHIPELLSDQDIPKKEKERENLLSDIMRNQIHSVNTTEWAQKFTFKHIILDPFLYS